MGLGKFRKVSPSKDLVGIMMLVLEKYLMTCIIVYCAINKILLKTNENRINCDIDGTNPIWIDLKLGPLKGIIWICVWV